MEDLMQKLSGYLDAAEGVLKEYGPQAMDAALFVVRFDAVWHLVLGLLLLAGAVVVVVKTYRPVGRIIASGEPEIILLGIATIPTGLVAVMLAELLQPVYWISAFDPMLGLVYKAAQSAGLL